MLTLPIKHRHRLFEVSVLVLFLAIVGYQLFVPPLIGVSDNGDFSRFLYQAGLEHTAVGYDQHFRYFNSKYQIIPIPEITGSYKSSTILPIRAARWVNVHFISGAIFDVRVLAAVYLLFFLVGLYLILVSTRKLALRWSIPLAGLLLFMFTDPGSTAYLNTFYSEPTALVALLIAVGCSLTLISGRPSIVALIGYTLAAAVLVTAKPMYVPLAPLLGGYGVYLSGLMRLRNKYWLGGIAACALATVGVWYSQQTTAGVQFVVNFGGVFNVINGSTTPEDDLRAMGLNPDWKRYAVFTPYDQNGPVNNPGFRAEFAERVNSMTVPAFLLRRPTRFYRTIEPLSRLVMASPNPDLGHYEKASGKQTYAQPPAPWSAIRGWVFPSSIWFLVIYFSSGILTAAYSIRRITRPVRGLLLLYSLFVSFSAVAFFMPALTMASWDTRYSATFVAGLDMALALAIGSSYLLIEKPFLKLKKGYEAITSRPA